MSAPFFREPDTIAAEIEAAAMRESMHLEEQLLKMRLKRRCAFALAAAGLLSARHATDELQPLSFDASSKSDL